MSKRTFSILSVLFFLGIMVLDVIDAEAQRRRGRSRGIRSALSSRSNRIGQISFHAGGGIASYFGDLKDEVVLWAKPSVQLGASYRIHQNFLIRSEIMWYRISGADSLNDPIETTIYDRNLSFRSDNFEFNVTAVAYLFNKYSRYNRPIINPYIFGGIGLSTNNPKTEYQGEMVDLRPLETERVEYAAVVPVFPFGIGITYHVNNNWDISLEYGYRATFSDYLDDASTDYPDEILFAGDPLAYALSDRRIPNARYQGDNYRGNPDNDDWYLITGMKVTYSPGPASRKRYRRAKR